LLRLVTMGKVYLLLCVDSQGAETFKIGHSTRDVSLRIKELQTGNSNVITVLNEYETPNFKNLEGWLHTRFSKQRTDATNEWFNLTSEQVGSFTQICEELDSTITFMKKNNPFFK